MACGGGGCKGEEESSEYGSGIGQSVLKTARVGTMTEPFPFVPAM